MKRKCQFCGTEVEITEDMLGDSKIDCPECGHYICAEIEAQAILYAEKTGVSEYEVNEDGWFEYWSFFPGEGFRFVQHNLNTGEERRDGFIPWQKDDGIPVPSFLREFDPNNDALWWCKYNYNIG